MATSREDIRRWLVGAKDKGYAYMLVVCDTFDYGDYPVEVKHGEDPHLVVRSYNGKDMQRVMEVYDLRKDLEQQLAERRAWNLPGEHKLDKAIRKMGS